MTAEDESSGGKRPFHARLAARLCGMVAARGWPRRILLTAALAVFLVALAIVRGGADYRSDPSALAPRSASLYVETRDIELLLKNIGAWPLWDAGFRSPAGSRRSHAQEALAGRLGSLVAGLGTHLPLLWIAGGGRTAAFVIGDGETPGEKAWALYLHAPDPSLALADLRVEPGLRLEPIRGGRDGLYTLTGAGEARLCLAALEPWLIVSSDAILPAFAFESVRRPAGSLAYSDIVPEWRRNVSLRGMGDPAYLIGRPDVWPLLGPAGKWLDPKARLAFAVGLDAEGEMRADIVVETMDGHVRGGGVWPLVTAFLCLLGFACLLLILAICAAVVGWTGWLKALAMRAGAKPKPERAMVTPSAAFDEDAGAPAVVPERCGEDGETSDSVDSPDSPDSPDRPDGMGVAAEALPSNAPPDAAPRDPAALRDAGAHAEYRDASLDDNPDDKK